MPNFEVNFFKTIVKELKIVKVLKLLLNLMVLI